MIKILVLLMPLNTMVQYVASSPYVVILSCGTGGGHNAAASAIYDELKSRGHQVTFMDPYDLVSKRLTDHVDDLYIKIVQTSPKAFGFLYDLGEMHRKLPIHSPVYWINGKIADLMEGYLRSHYFDYIVMTHMYPAHILAHLKNKIILPKTILIATDYTCIPFMEETDCDQYIIPSSDLISEFSKRGIPSDKLIPLGIPVRRGFTLPYDKKEVRDSLGLSNDHKYILLAGGSIGAGKLEDTIESLVPYLFDNNDHLIVICGNNDELYEDLMMEYADDMIKIIKSTDKMADLMKACDLFISKPGGLSSTEAAVVNIPLIHISPIPGCETYNAKYFKDRKMSILVEDPKEELIDKLKTLDKDTIAMMIDAQRRYIDKDSTTKICDLMEATITY